MGMDAGQEYTRLSTVQKAFEQYKNLWTTVHDWMVNKEKWFHSPLMENNAEFVEKSVNDSARLLSKCEKVPPAVL